MTIHFEYEKQQVLQALRYHFVSKPEIRIMIILVNVFAIFAIILAVVFTALITATLGEIIQQFNFRQYLSVAAFAAILFGMGYFVGCARRG